jgi:hypothetical protein
MLKKASKDNCLVLKLAMNGQLFRLLEIFAVNKNPNAPIIYKSLTFSLIENHADETVREFMVKSFIEIFETIPSIPVSIVVDPLIKCMQTNEMTTYQFNTFDFDLFLAIAKHPKLTLLPSGLTVLDQLSRIYLS